MTNEEILEKQVEALEKLLQLRAAIIEELEAKNAKLNSDLSNARLQWPGVVTTPWISPAPMPTYPWGGTGTIVISNTCPDGLPHQYPSTWGGTNLPSCTKCGAQQSMNPFGGNITLTSAHINSQPVGAGGTCGTPLVHTTGYLQNADLAAGDALNVSNNSKNNIFTLNRITK